MKDYGIPFSPAMVSAIFAGRKNTTRRLLPEDGGLPYAPGDRLWVRETHFRFGLWERDWTKEAKEGKRPPLRFVPMSETSFDPPRYPITARQGPPSDPAQWAVPAIYRRPARFMFRADARLKLVVEECFAADLHAVQHIDAMDEGIASISKDGKLLKFGIPDRDGLPGTDNEGWPWPDWQTTSRAAFARLWNSIHGDDAFDQNPRVSVTRFKIAD